MESACSSGLATEHTQLQSKAWYREDVFTDCLPYWLHPEYQSSAAAVGQHPSGRSWQLSAGACHLSDRREGGKQLASKSVWLWACLQVRHRRRHTQAHVSIISRTLETGCIRNTQISPCYTPGWASWWPVCTAPSASLTFPHSRVLPPMQKRGALTEK